MGLLELGGFVVPAGCRMVYSQEENLIFDIGSFPTPRACVLIHKYLTQVNEGIKRTATGSNAQPKGCRMHSSHRMRAKDGI